MNILILGGISEARWLAETLANEGRHQVIYSIVGKGEVPNIDCPIRVGGFSGHAGNGIDGLIAYIEKEQIDLLIDATHPYAATISLHAYEAADRTGVRFWGYQRAPWPQKDGDFWIQTPDWFSALEFSDFRRPFITIGSSVEEYLGRIPKGQHWLVRALPGKLPYGENYELIGDRGPYSYEEERALLIEKEVDVIVAKNSGGAAVSAKIRAARELGLAVILQSRPNLPEPERLFIDIATLHEALTELN